MKIFVKDLKTNKKKPNKVTKSKMIGFARGLGENSTYEGVFADTCGLGRGDSASEFSITTDAMKMGTFKQKSSMSTSDIREKTDDFTALELFDSSNDSVLCCTFANSIFDSR